MNVAIEELIGEVLREKHLMMGTAESCTGGRVAAMITQIPGSSDYFSGGIVSYSNKIKHTVLGVSEEDLQTHGAVSRAVVEQMALGAIRTLDCDCAVATSGVAGPGGGSPDKPVGTVWVAAAWGGKVVSKCYHFGTIRGENIRQGAHAALKLLFVLLQKKD